MEDKKTEIDPLPKKHFFSGIKLFVAGLLVGGIITLLLTYLFKIPFKSADNAYKDEIIARLNDQIATLREEKQTLLTKTPSPTPKAEALGKFLKTYSQPYSFETVGVYSALFNGKTVTLMDFSFKPMGQSTDNLVTEKTIPITFRNGITEAGSEIYEYTKWQGEDYVYFGGYENYVLHPIYIKELLNKPDKYLNKSGISMTWSYEYTPKSIGLVALNFLTHNTLNGNPMYVRIWELTNSLDIKDDKDPLLSPIKTNLQSLADTISLSISH